MRVALVDEGWSSTLYVARAFAAAGHDVTVLTANGRRDSYRRPRVTWLSIPRLGDDASLDALGLGSDFDRIVPLSEPAMLAIWRSRWSDRAFPATESWQRAIVADKHALVAHVAGAGVAIPRSRPAADADSAIAALGLPVVVKGSTGCAGSRVFIADTRPALAAALARARELDGTWIVQEYMPGPTYLVAGVFDHGRPLRVYAAEKLEQYPARTGPAIRLQSRCDPELVATGLRAIAALGWTGFASADLVRTRGGYALLEINPRLWGSVAGAFAAGVDMLAPFVELVAGRTPPADLAFADGADCMIFPRGLAVHPLGALRALFGPQGEDWRHPGFLRYLIARARG